jgi:uncharacterized OsmC-like protein
MALDDTSLDSAAAPPHHAADQRGGWLALSLVREGCMADGVKIDTVRSGSSGVLGRSLNSARHQHFVLDSPSGPNEAITNGEAFLAGISSCGVTLIEKHAHDTGVPLRSMEVVIEGIRSNAAPNRFQSIHVTFEMRGVSQAAAQALVETWRDR